MAAQDVNCNPKRGNLENRHKVSSNYFVRPMASRHEKSEGGFSSGSGVK